MVHKHVSTLLSRGDKTVFSLPVQPSGRVRAVGRKEKGDPAKKKKLNIEKKPPPPLISLPPKLCILRI